MVRDRDSITIEHL